MAQTNFTPILLYASSTVAAVPLAANLTNSATGSEIAINVADKNLFFKDSTNAVNTVPIRQSSTSSNGWLSNTDWNTFNGKYSVGNALGTPSSGTVTNLTGTASININGTVGATTPTTGAFTTIAANSTIKGAATISVGNATPSASGAGITFPATQSASTDVNTLDDYEEGTWTPNQGSGLTVVGAFSSNGTYTKVGRLVTVTGNVSGATSISCTAAGVICSNLPFSTTNAYNGSVGVSNANQSASVVVYSLTAYCGTAIAGTSTSIGFTVTYEV